MISVSFFFFFFQAEDGIRDVAVTGVQTCALPIYQVEVHATFSKSVARGWSRPIRFLWIDGDHTYHGAKQDLDLFAPHLVDGGIVALHDVLHRFEGPIRVFVEDVLRSDRYGPAGVCGSIVWAQCPAHDGGRAPS